MKTETTRSLIAALKENGQDEEFYPTTDEIIARMLHDLKMDDDRREIGSVLDIGAGNGKVLLALQKGYERGLDLYAIEKSLMLCSRLSKIAFVIGTDFKSQSLLSKQIDLTFCNPPYTEFEEWAVKIIRESASRRVYLVLPVRWHKSVRIADALKHREAKVKTLGEYSFEDAEDRQARAIVNLIRIDLSTEKDDAFDRFFDEQFAHLKARYEAATKGESKYSDKKDPKFTALVGGANLLESLVTLYDADMEKAKKNYDLAAQLDVDLLKELDVTPQSILKCLKTRLTGLRSEYWKELFSHMSAVTNRLCSKKRGTLLDTLNRNGHIDFTTDNAYAVLMWVLEHANQYIDEQLVETFETMCSKANVKNYKSNLKPFVWDQWRYNQEKPTHVALEYRIVLDRVGGIKKTEWIHDKGLEQRAAEFLGDLLTVAHNLGFTCDTTDSRLFRRDEWHTGSVEHFECTVKDKDGNPKHVELFEVRAFLNGNMHIRLNQKFALALNVEHGRLKGWIKTAAEAVEELGDVEAASRFNSCFRLGSGNLPLMIAG